jgi:hypothetical protein
MPGGIDSASFKASFKFLLQAGCANDANIAVAEKEPTLLRKERRFVAAIIRNLETEYTQYSRHRLWQAYGDQREVGKTGCIGLNSIIIYRLPVLPPKEIHGTI